MAIEARQNYIGIMKQLYRAGVMITRGVLGYIKPPCINQDPYIVELVEEELHGGVGEDGVRHVKTLQMLAKECVRIQMVVARGGKNVRFSFGKLPIPSKLQKYLGDWSLVE